MKKNFHYKAASRVKTVFRIILTLQLGLLGNSFAQSTASINGKVIDSKTEEPLGFVSLYLSQTTIGSNTDENGNYIIHKIPAGKHLLVVSMVGYKPQIQEITLSKNENITITFKLEPTTYQFGQIEITGGSNERWKDQLNIFKKYIIGENEFSDRCKILNEDKIEFKEKNNRLTASINEPLMVNNVALGYKIECILYSFIYNEKTNTASYLIFPRFIENKSSSKDSIEYYIDNRNNAYLGSVAHFLKAVAANTLFYEGFKLITKNMYGDRIVYYDSNDIMEYNKATNKFYLRFSTPIKVEYSDSHKSQTSLIQLNYGTAEFDPSGYFVNPDEFVIEGDLAKGGLACMLPTDWKLQYEQ